MSDNMSDQFKTADGILVFPGITLYSPQGGVAKVNYITKQGAFVAPPYPLEVSEWYCDKNKANEKSTELYGEPAHE